MRESHASGAAHDEKCCFSPWTGIRAHYTVRHRNADNHKEFEMDLKTFKAIAPGIDKEVEAVFLKYGLKVGKRSASVDPREVIVNFRLTLVDTNLKDASGASTTPEAVRFARDAAYVGLKPEWLNQSFKIGGSNYTVVGLRSGRSSKPVLVTVAGKPGTYVLSCESVRVGFGLPKDQSLEELRKLAVG